MQTILSLSIEDLFYSFGERLVSGDTIHLPLWVPVLGVLIGLILASAAWSLPKPSHHGRTFFFQWVVRYLDVYVTGSIVLTVGVYFCAREWPIHTVSIGLGLLALIAILTGIWPNVMHFVAMELVYDAFGMRLLRALGVGVIFTLFAGAFYVHEHPPLAIMVGFAVFIVGATYTAFRWRLFHYIDHFDE